nr:hypothetical protein [Tanacetum cinerariifolium]
MYMAQLQEVSPDAADSGPIFDDEPLQKVLNDDHYNVFAIEKSSNNFFKEANNRLSETNNLLYADYKKSEAELARHNSKEYASQIELECEKVREMKDKLSAHQENISIVSKQKEAQIKLYKTREDKELEKVIELEKSQGVISTTSVSRPQLKSNPMVDRVMRNSSQGKKQEVEDQRRNVNLPKNKTSVTACNDSLNAKTLNVNFVSAMCDKCVLIDKHDMCVLNPVAKPIKRTVASESNQKPRNITRKLYERVSKTCSWWYPKFIPSGYKWKPKSGKENVNLNVSMPLGNASRTANVMDTMTSRRSIVSNTSLSSNSFAARRDYPIHRRLLVLKAHD